MKYKKTLKFPKTNFPMLGELAKNQEKFQIFWIKNEIYKKRLEKNKNLKKLVFHDGPPYANGPIHIGHALNKILKDFIVRFKNMNNYYLDFVPGWDTHGLPIEKKIEVRYKKNFKNFSTSQIRKLSKEFAISQIKIQQKQFEKLNLFFNFENKYKTFDRNYTNNELDLFLKLFKNNLIYWATRPVSWSYSSKTALAESEIIYLNKTENSIYFFFPSEDIKQKKLFSEFEDLNFIIWTTTPYTLESNVAIAINKKINYLIFKFNNKNFVCCENSFSEIKKFLNLDQIEEIKIILGEELIGIKYKNIITNEINQIFHGDFVSDDSGSGIVHVAGGFGLEDYKLAVANNIPIYCSIDENGNFYSTTKFEPINNQFYVDGGKIIIEHLKKLNFLLEIKQITHKIAHDWRTQVPTIYRATNQWFINIKTIKNDLKNFHHNINSYPDWVGEKLEKNILNRDEWCISRQRSWGVCIPILFNNNEPILDIKQIENNIKLIKKHGVEIWYKEKCDFFVIEKFKNLKNLSKSKDILDVWFDSGSSFLNLPNQQSDFYLEGFDQLRGWFNSSTILSFFVNKKPPFKNLIGHGFVLDKDGNKMSKSIGNILDPMDFCAKYGGDILRLWVANVNYIQDIKFNDNLLENIITQYRKIRNTLFRYSLSLVEDFEFNENVLKNLKNQENIYIYHLFCKTFKQSISDLENFSFLKSIKNFINFVNLYSNWFLEISKDTLYCSEESEKKEILSIVYTILEHSILFFSIFIPQTCEEAYQYFPKKNKEISIFLENFREINLPDYSINLNYWNNFFELKDKVYLEIEKKRNLKTIFNSHEVKLIISEKLISEFNIDDLKKYLNIAEIESVNKENDFIEITKTNLNFCERCRRYYENINTLCFRCKNFLDKSNS